MLVRDFRLLLACGAQQSACLFTNVLCPCLDALLKLSLISSFQDHSVYRCSANGDVRAMESAPSMYDGFLCFKKVCVSFRSCNRKILAPKITLEKRACFLTPKERLLTFRLTRSILERCQIAAALQLIWTNYKPSSQWWSLVTECQILWANWVFFQPFENNIAFFKNDWRLVDTSKTAPTLPMYEMLVALPPPRTQPPTLPPRTQDHFYAVHELHDTAVLYFEEFPKNVPVQCEMSAMQFKIFSVHGFSLVLFFIDAGRCVIRSNQRSSVCSCYASLLFRNKVLSCAGWSIVRFRWWNNKALFDFLLVLAELLDDSAFDRTYGVSPIRDDSAQSAQNLSKLLLKSGSHCRRKVECEDQQIFARQSLLSIGVVKGGPPQIFCIHSNFVLWEAVSQTK